MEETKKTEPRRFYGRPADRSLPAYKGFIRGMVVALNPDAKDDIKGRTEEQWRDAWKQFWAAANEAPGSHEE